MQHGGVAPGSRTVKGSVTSASLAAAQGWARQQRVFLTGDRDGIRGPLPEEIENGREFVARVDGAAIGNGANPKLFRVNFTFGEVLPNYPAPS